LVPVPISGVVGAEGPHAEGKDLGMLRIYMSDFDGFLREYVFVALFAEFLPMSLPSTEDAKFCNEDHGESRKSGALCEDEAFEDPFQPSDDVS
jgi:hypothetical protein